MQSQIHILPEILRNQIAAGEVVERPASAVKELVENALDAGAKNIEIHLEESGLKRIEVQDDGGGMNADDVALSIKRHATSKIIKKEDLFNIHTMGFRGEALASIASVSLFRLESRQENSVSGNAVEVHAGFEHPVQPCAGKIGTRVIVEDLFDNVPVRKKFLKTESTELKHCVEVVEDIAFCNPQTSFVLTHNGKEVLKVFAESFEDRLKNLVSNDVFQSLIPVRFSSPFAEITGFVSRPGEVFKTRNYQKIFVNGRSIKDATVQAAVSDAFRSFLEKGAYPAFYLFLEIPADLLDVNVHPRKSEVKFLRGNEVFSAIRSALLEAFEKKHKSFQSGESSENFQQFETPQNFSFQKSFSPEKKYSSSSPSFSSQKSFSNPSRKEIDSALEFTKTLLAPKQTLDFGFHQMQEQEDELAGYKIVGQAAKKFLILEKESRIVFLDQHAVHERARYDELIRAFQSKSVQSQQLLVPEIIECSSSESILIEEHLEILESLGFTLESFGKNVFQVLSVPVSLSLDNLKETIIKVCEELGNTGKSHEVNENIEKALTYISCRGSIMFGDELSLQEMKAVVKDWLKFAKGLTCPHGRPLGFEMTMQEMEKKVGR